MRQKIIFIILFITSGIGILLSAYSLAAHYDLASTDFCTFSDTLNCDLVNKSIYSEIVGIPIALLGVIGYSFLFIGSLMKWKNPHDHLLSRLLIFLSLIALLFSLYLTSIEAFILQTWCLVCVASQLTIFIFFITSLIEYQKNRRNI
ncbi:hypothetical protein CO172_03300 [Candidatus Uhrbacteria bacterium CG_4_9_14_3_um_filter_36_7]|uniref:Vitamin K epoxide reductase domain-containing protein n=1 Tax=Candidatus Uhrbacteria bacterium CG_4_9_14_3_um_filter_36_7 TaxID=1975033 RepID=A0A2M7XGF6_9BACT|nr:MAG: hypothetical protein CO172_03300 [Candidatus Uhrbacteria bacterium CG_4_9_14_3_um_filter_36_7]